MRWNVAKAVMIQGTGSGAGKSLITAALCRIFSNAGLNVAPFKAQNMALNSYIALDGGEIGRAQALQAEAARVEPTSDMNPILLKVSGEGGSQVIINGLVHSRMTAQEYYAFKKTAWKAVDESYKRLSKKHDVIVLEGAGSPAEINLMDVDIVNMASARLANAAVFLVGDIDKGGVFASLYGTVKLLGRDARRIKGFIINKFRGDMEILRPGLEMIAEKTGKPVIGVLPFIKELNLPEEDGFSLKPSSRDYSAEIKIAVLRLQYISNFTDFDSLALEDDVELFYSTNPSEIENADMLIIPGSKNTVRDLAFLRRRGIDKSITKALERGASVMGMCGGYQMLGKNIFDLHAVESPEPITEGLGLLNIETTFEHSKTTCRVEAESIDSIGEKLKGYEIHMGTSTGDIGLFNVRRHDESAPILDGSRQGNVWGTYIHGIFDNDSFRRETLNKIRSNKGLAPLPISMKFAEARDRAIESLADVVKRNLDMDFIRKAMGL